MKYVPNTAMLRAVRLAFFPVCLFGLVSLSCAHAALAALPKNDDTVVISSADALSDADMGANRGGSITTTTTVISSQTMNSTSTGNAMNVNGNMTNGNIVMGNNFGGSGFGSYVMNTGNNAVINSGVSVSVLTIQ
jgi:hypothetical protein